ncbi:MAG: hypothetical protein ACLQM8_18430 [Limisphaerales bacterium]
MTSYIRWWETEWFKQWERLALHQAAQVDLAAARKLGSPVSTVPANANGNTIRETERQRGRF